MRVRSPTNRVFPTVRTAHRGKTQPANAAMCQKGASAFFDKLAAVKYPPLLYASESSGLADSQTAINLVSFQLNALCRVIFRNRYKLIALFD